jgi:hypothetical protein
MPSSHTPRRVVSRMRTCSGLLGFNRSLTVCDDDAAPHVRSRGWVRGVGTPPLRRCEFVGAFKTSGAAAQATAGTDRTSL